MTELKIYFTGLFGQIFGDGNGCFLSLWFVGHRKGLRNILLEFVCQTIGDGYGCFVSLWPIGHRDRLIVLYRTYSANIYGRGTAVWYLCALRAQRGGSISLDWTFSAKHLRIDMVVACVADISGFISTGYIAN